jgi:hypothetical protein
VGKWREDQGKIKRKRLKEADQNQNEQIKRRKNYGRNYETGKSGKS